MDKIKQLENKKLLKELEFVETDFEYKTEIISEADTNFIKNINEFLLNHPELKNMIDKRMNDKIDRMVKEKEQSDNEFQKEKEVIDEKDSQINQNTEENEETEVNDNKVVRSEKIKKLYREIVKLTHPDKANDIKLNDIYIKSTKSYDENDLISIYAICSDLSIEYESDETDNIYISDRITVLKERINFMESTFTWKWHTADNNRQKDDVLMNYIRAQLM
jgi:hypothetical protein